MYVSQHSTKKNVSSRKFPKEKGVGKHVIRKSRQKKKKEKGGGGK